MCEDRESTTVQAAVNGQKDVNVKLLLSHVVESLEMSMRKADRLRMKTGNEVCLVPHKKPAQD